MGSSRIPPVALCGVFALGAACGGGSKKDAAVDFGGGGGSGQDAARADAAADVPVDALADAFDAPADAGDSTVDPPSDGPAAESIDKPGDTVGETPPEAGDSSTESGAAEKPCPIDCTLGDFRCNAAADGVDECVNGPDGCPMWKQKCVLPSGRGCTGSGSSPTDCDFCATPAACVGLTTFPTTVCVSANATMICDQNADGLVCEAEHVTCPGAKMCQGTPGSVYCACPPPGDGTAGTGCTDAEAASKDPKVNNRCDGTTGNVTRCQAVGTGAELCYVWVAYPPCPTGGACTTSGGTSPHCAPK